MRTLLVAMLAVVFAVPALAFYPEDSESVAAVEALPGTFAITNTFSAHGTVVLNGVPLPVGSSVTYVSPGLSPNYTFTADSGYVLSDVVVDGVSVGTPSTYGFPSISADHTLAVSFALAPPPPEPPHSGGGGGGGGGGCSMVAAGNVNAFGWALPYGVLLAGWLVARRRKVDARV